MTAWPRISLGEVLKQDTQYFSEPEPRLYPKLSVKLYGRGAVLDTPADGSSVKMRKHQLARSGQVILSEIWAKKGAIGIVPSDGDGALCTSHFFLFDIDKSKVLPGYIDWLLRSNYFEPQLNAEARGTTGYAAIRPKQFLSTEIPLPPLTKQQALVASLDALNEKTLRVEAHLDAADQNSSALLLSLHHKLAGNRVVHLGGVLALTELPEAVTAAGNYPQVGVRGFGGGLFAKSTLSGTETSYKAFNRLYEGAIVLSQVKGWEGAIARCPRELDGWFVSPEYRTFKCTPCLASDEYFGELVKTEWFWSRLQEATHGVGARRERTRPEQFLNIEIPLPSLDNQLRIVEILKQQIPLKSRHSAIRKANAALLPATLERIFSTEAPTRASGFGA